MPVERVEPVAGAARVDFDFDAADEALAALTRTLPERLGDQVGPRRAAGNRAATDWRGYFRDEFDRAEGLLLSRIESGAAWGATGPVSAIHAAAGRANDRQRQLNQQRLDALAEEERRRREQEGAGTPAGG